MRQQWTGGQTCDLLCQTLFCSPTGLFGLVASYSCATSGSSTSEHFVRSSVIPAVSDYKKQYHNAQFKAHEISCGYWMCYVSKYTVVPYIQLQLDTTAYPSYSSTQQTRTDTHRLWYEHAEYSPCQSLLFLAHSATQTLVNKFINTKNQTDQLLLLFSAVWRPTLLTSDHNS